MAKTLKEIDKDIKTAIGSKKNLNKIVHKDDLRHYVNGQLADLTSTLAAVKGFSGVISTKELDGILAKKGNGITKAYAGYIAKLSKASRKAAKDELSRPFKSLEEPIEKYIELLESLQGKLDELFTQNTVSINNAKISHAVIIAVLTEAKIISRFAKYLVSGVISAACNIDEYVTKYRVMFVEQNMENVLGYVAKYYDNIGAAALNTILSDIKVTGQDITILNDDGESQVAVIGQLHPQARGIVSNGFIGNNNIFRTIGEMFANARESSTRRIENEKEWLEAHVTLIKLRTEGMDENDPKYIKLVRAIDRYDQMISKLDKKLTKLNQD